MGKARDGVFQICRYKLVVRIPFFSILPAPNE